MTKDSNATEESEEARAERIRAQLDFMKNESVRGRLAVLQQAYPEIVGDAEAFVADAKCMPWDFAVAFIEGELLEIQEKYGVRPSRGRPPFGDVHPETDLFLEACELIDERTRLENQAATEFILSRDPRRR